jgi:hypothetical protein
MKKVFKNLNCLLLVTVENILQSIFEAKIQSNLFNIFICRGMRVNYKTFLNWMTGFIDLLHIELGIKGNTALSLIYTLQFTVTHALGYTVFTSRILATDL